MLTQGECNRLKGINEALEDIIIKRYGEDYSDQHHNLSCMMLFENHVPNKEEELLFDLVDTLKGLQMIENNNREALNNQDKELDTGEEE